MLRVLGARQRIVNYLHQERNGADAAVYTFSDVPLGTEHSSRIIVIGVRFVGAGTGVSSVRLGGVETTERVSTTFDVAALWSLAAPTGTTADIRVQSDGAGNGTAVECKIAVWSLLHFQNTAPHDSDSSTAAIGSVSVDVPNRGAVIGYAGGPQGPFTWTGLTRDFTAGTTTVEGGHSGAHLADMSAQTGYAITADSTGAGFTDLVVTSWS